MTSKSSGTVTFLSTDIENSTQLAREHPESWEAAKARHNAILREELGDAEFQALAAKGRSMTIERAIAYALKKE